MISEKEILNNMTADEKFTIICRIKQINIDKMTESIIRKIQNSNIEDKDIYIGKSEVWDDEYMYVTCIYHQLFIDKSLAWSKEQAIEEFKEDLDNDWELNKLWIELSTEEKDFIQLALDCGVNVLKVEMM